MTRHSVPTPVAQGQRRRPHRKSRVPLIALVATIGLLSITAPDFIGLKPQAAEAYTGLCSGDSGSTYNPCGYSTPKLMKLIAAPYYNTLMASSHRGLHALTTGAYAGTVENNKGAILGAAQSGLAQIELDVKPTSDGIPVLSHDLTIGRATNYGSNGAKNDGGCEAGGCFNPLRDPDFVMMDGKTNGSKNPTLSSISAATFTSLYGRDSISGEVNEHQPHPLSLQEALDIMTANKVQMVLALDLRTVADVQSVLPILKNTLDSSSRPYLETSLLKIPFLQSPSSAEVSTMFGSYKASVHYQPVFNTGDACRPTKLQGGLCRPFRDARNAAEGADLLLSSFREVEKNAGVDIPAVEVQYKGGTLMRSFIQQVRIYGDGRNAFRSLTAFSPFEDITAERAGRSASEGPFFFKTNGYCCDTLSSFFFRPSPEYIDDFGQDTEDRRPDANFLLQEGFNAVTTDNALTFAKSYDTTLRDLNRQQRGEQPSTPFPTPYVPPGGQTPYNPPFQLGTDHAPRVMVVGDSITNGYEGDYTWRYRLWQWMDSQRLGMNFVGPFSGTLPQKPGAKPQPPALQGSPAGPSGIRPADDSINLSGGYAKDSAGGSLMDPNFLSNSRHYSVWGRQLIQDTSTIGDVMRGTVNGRSQDIGGVPDLLVVELGFNDVGWLFADGKTLADDVMHNFVLEAQKANPNVAIVLGTVPQRTVIGGREDLPVRTTAFNSEVAKVAPSWSTSTSSVVTADVDKAYNCDQTKSTCDSAYDGLHPSNLGEYRIANAFETALHDKLGLGSSVPAVPSTIPVRVVGVPAKPTYINDGQGASATWNPVYGAHSYDVQWRDTTASGTDGPWQSATAATARWDKSWQFFSQVVSGDTYQIRVRASAGDADTLKGSWSPITQGVADPKTLPGPKITTAEAIADGVHVEWQAVSNSAHPVTEYSLSTYDTDTPTIPSQTVGIRGLSADIHGLTRGHHYVVYMTTWNDLGEGLPSSAPNILVGGTTTPGQPTLKGSILDDTGNKIRLTWNSIAGTDDYRLWTRSTDSAGSQLESTDFVTTDTSYDYFAYYPGVTHMQICIVAENGTRHSNPTGQSCITPAR